MSEKPLTDKDLRHFLKMAKVVNKILYEDPFYDVCVAAGKLSDVTREALRRGKRIKKLEGQLKREKLFHCNHGDHSED